ncbi:diguanylate cyclase [Luteimonas sp BLCC-B24]|uniref:sensor domain-containing diguanylate cyclase n=1 Tax=Luteimonas sp. BLCC-B24 TaxID=3025317 RepID=UPI00234DE1E5|nr:GGDEF domain-containing protein [Luteimonas sp. BLCC-B24]MDC7807658.1 diguanylate cyclase [Luteimonas sp. BLCC-B24]
MALDTADAMPGHRWVLAGCLLLLLGLFAMLAASTQLRPHEQRPVTVVDLSPDARFGEAVRRVELRFDLPPTERSQGRWALWFPREPVVGLHLTRADGWRSEIRDFFRVGDDEGMFPNGYGFVLPADWQGPVQLDVRYEGLLQANLAPVLARAGDVRRIERSGVALSAALYGALLALATLALALAYASRDRLFLGFFGVVFGLALLLQAANGHLYGLPAGHVFGHWGLQGTAALALLYAAATQCLIEAYAMPRRHRRARLTRAIAAALVLLAALCLLNLRALAPLVWPLTLLGWALSGTASIAMLVDATRRGVRLAGWVLIAAVVATVGGVWITLVRLGMLADIALLHFAYQGALVAFVFGLGLALISRIGDYRDQRDRDRLARLDTERKMQRERARANLTTALQTQLNGLDPGELPWQGFRLLMDHLLPLVPHESCVAVLRGYQGRDHLLVEPADALPAIEHEIQRRGLILRRQATAGIALQQPVQASSGGPVVAMEALVPLQVRAPGWAALLLRRAGGEGFTTDEMSVIGELLRLTQLQVDQAAAAVKLRRSAEIDALTGTMNRRTLDLWVERTFADAERTARPVSVLFVDLDHFKSVNDRYGHACGDDCLRAVSTALRSVLSEADMFGRYGGEEFIAVLPGHDGAEARAIGERMRTAVENVEVRHEGLRVRLTVSIGIATRQPGEDAPAAAIARADKALYAAKRQGRNCVQVAPAVFS